MTRVSHDTGRSQHSSLRTTNVETGQHTVWCTDRTAMGLLERGGSGQRRRAAPTSRCWRPGPPWWRRPAPAWSSAWVTPALPASRPLRSWPSWRRGCTSRGSRQWWPSPPYQVPVCHPSGILPAGRCPVPGAAGGFLSCFACWTNCSGLWAVRLAGLLEELPIGKLRQLGGKFGDEVQQALGITTVGALCLHSHTLLGLQRPCSVLRRHSVGVILCHWCFAGELARMPRSRLDAAVGEEKVSRQTCLLAAVLLITCSQSYGSLGLVHAHAMDAAAMWHGMRRRGGWRGWRGGWTTRR